MRILIINYEYPPLGGGAGHATQQWVRHLLAEGHEIYLFTGKFGDIAFPDHHKNLHVHQVAHGRPSMSRASIGSFLRFIWAGFWYLPKLVRQNRPERCLAVFLFPCGPLAWWLCLREKLPYILALRGGDVPGAEPGLSWLHWLLTPLRRTIYGRSNGVFANSQGLADLAQARDPVQVAIIPNGVDTDQFSPPPEKPMQPLRFLFAGRFQSQKNLAFTLDCMDQVLSKLLQAEFEMVGEGPLKQDLINQVKKLKNGARIRLKTWLDPEALRTCMTKAHLLINLSLYEGMPNIVLQAAACGLPSLVSDVIGNREVVIAGQTGWCVPLDREKVVETCIQLGQVVATLIRIGKAASEYVQKNYSWSTSSEALYQLLSASPDQAGRMSK